ncbi:DUF5324 family protein [Streptomyces sp. 4N509B]|uniref:DUF5324 family protein n=1 Tax=Streptomyces sp. 4N509B TaxID=3457413 RepID=UPI003FD4D6A4
MGCGSNRGRGQWVRGERQGNGGTTRMRRAAAVVVPGAVTAGTGAVRQARRAGAYVGPRAARAVRAARTGYGEQVAPRLEAARAAAGPVSREARARSEVAVVALRGAITPREARLVIRGRERRRRIVRVARRLGVAGLVAACAFAGWKWWERQSSPEWLVEPSPATEVPPAELAEEAAQAEAETQTMEDMERVEQAEDMRGETEAEAEAEAERRRKAG